MAKLVIWGASGHAKVVADIVRLAGGYDLIGFLDDLHVERHGQQFSNSLVLGGQECLDSLHERGVTNAIIAVGDCPSRLRLAEIVQRHGFSLATAIHPRAIIASGVSIGPGTVICAGAIVNPDCSLGANVIINTAASVDHDCIIEDGVHVGPGVRLGGGVRIERAAWLGIGSTLKDHVTVGAGSLLGAGAVLLRDLPPAVVAYGSPATVRKRLTTYD